MTDPNTEAMELWRKANDAYFAKHHHPVRAPINSLSDQAAAAIISASLQGYKARIAALEGALVLAANRLDVCVVDAIADGNERRRCAYTGWAEAARQSLEADHGA